MDLRIRYITIYLSLILFALSSAVPLGAQSGTELPSLLGEKGFSAGVGFGHVQFKDRLINNLRYEGAVLSCAFGYAFGNELRHEVQLNLSTDLLHNRYSMEPWTAHFAIKYSLHDYFAEQGLLLGGFFNFSNFFYNNDYFDSQHNYWASHIDLGLSLVKAFRASDNVAISVPFYLPLVGFKSRPASDRNLILNEADTKPSEVLSRINSNYKFGLVGNGFFYFGTGIDVVLRFCSSKRFTAGYHIYFEQDKLGASPEYQYITHSLNFKYAL